MSNNNRLNNQQANQQIDAKISIDRESDEPPYKPIFEHLDEAGIEFKQRQYHILLELAKAMVSHHKISDLFADLAVRLPRLFDIQMLYLMLHNESRNTMQMHILETSNPAMQKFPEELPIEGSISGWVWQHQEPFVTDDISQDERFVVPAILQDFPLKSLCSLPLTTASQRLGVLNIASDKIGVYQRLDLQFAGLVAAQVAVAVENAFNFQQARHYQQQLMRERDLSAMLLEINNMLVSNLNLKELFSALSVCLQKVVPHDYAGLAIYDASIDRLRVSALEFPDHQDFFAEDEILPVEGSAWQAFTTGQIVLTGVCENTHEVGQRFAALGMRSACIIPLISHGRKIGFISVQSRHENAFKDDEVELLSQVSKQIAIAVENAVAFREIDQLKNRLEAEKLYLEEEIRSEYNFQEIIGKSAMLKKVLREVETVAPTDSTILIYGETGTGKELIARAIHNLSARHKRTLVKVNCAAIPGGLLESELLGHERGAFTGAIERRVGRFELANGGTIFLDEVGEIPLELQPKLLRVLQEQEFERLGSTKTIKVDVRVVAATNCDLAQMVADKTFRRDLYYRLNVFPITLPPLRERPEDIPLLVRFFVQKFAARMKKNIDKIPSEVMDALVHYSWPGNIRELENFIERKVILTRGSVFEVPSSELKSSGKNHLEPGDAITMEAVEREHVLRVLRETNWVIGGPTGAAARLGLNRTTLNNRLRKLGISRPRG